MKEKKKKKEKETKKLMIKDLVVALLYMENMGSMLNF